MIGCRFQDMMDADRVVEPRQAQGSVYMCAIYWRHGGVLRFGGMAPIPNSLLSNPRIGFSPVK